MEKNLLENFELYLLREGKSINTTKGYLLDIKNYLKWFLENNGENFKNLTRENIIAYKKFLLTENNKNAKTINHYISSLKSFNYFLLEQKLQKDIVVDNKMSIRIQTQYASPTDINEEEVTHFREKILASGNKRNYALVTLLAYTGLRISEALNIKFSDFNLKTKECIIRSGKGGKQRSVPINEKVSIALLEYINNIKIDSEYLFSSNKSDKLDRTVVNRIFQTFSDKKITPHDLRHFFCTNALEKGFGIHEVASIAGHSNIQTTLLYTNPNKKKIQSKMELL